MGEERESLEESGDITAIGLLQSVDLVSDEADGDEVLASEGEELQEVDESAFGELRTSALEQ